MTGKNLPVVNLVIMLLSVIKKYVKTNDCSCFLAISDKWTKHLRKKVIHPHINLLKTKRKAVNSKPNHCSTDDGWLL